MSITSPLAKDVRLVFHEELDPQQRAALLSWLAFTTTFAAVRGITYSIRHGKGRFAIQLVANSAIAFARSALSSGLW
jgi:hypothetical protein